MRIIDTSEDIFRAYEADRFDLEKWKAYLDAAVPGAK